MISLGKSPALLHVQKNYRPFRKPFTACGPPCRLGIGKTPVNANLLVRKLARRASQIEEEKTKSLRLQYCAFPGPRIRFLSRRSAQPIARKRKRLAQQRQRRIPGILIAIKPNERFCRPRQRRVRPAF